MTINNTSIAFIGGGNMTQNLVNGLIIHGYSAQQIWVTNRTAEKLDFFREKNVNVSVNNLEAAALADILVLSVKPQQIQAVCHELKEIINEKRPLIISLAVGITTDMLAHWLGDKIAIVAAMPNTPCSLQLGVTGLYANALVNVAQKALAESIFRAVGLTVWVTKEEQISIIAAVSGSGPAYIFLFMEALQNVAEKLGLPKGLVPQLVAQTFLGASQMVIATQQDVVQLRRAVTSPGGTTEQAIKVFEENDIRKIFEQALAAAINRAAEISKKFG